MLCLCFAGYASKTQNTKHKTQHTMRTHLTLVSSNAKTGPIPVSTSSQETCPDGCPFKGKGKGCYAMSGPLLLHWDKVTKQERGFEWPQFVDAISRLPRNQLWRHNQAGDLPGVNEMIDTIALTQLVKANRGRRGYTYTHKYGTSANLQAIKAANDAGFAINLSANNLAQADVLASQKCGPVVVVLPSETTKNTLTPDGRRVVICPATQRDDISCATCGLCQKIKRSVIIGFPAHGTGKKTVSLISKN